MVGDPPGPTPQELRMNIGDRLPDFELENQYGETISAGGLSTGRVFLVFYPWAFSRVCGAELAELQAHITEFQRDGVRLAAISVDHKFALRSYAEQAALEYDLLADFWPHGAVAELFDAFDPQRGVATRVTLFVVDGTIRGRFESPLSEPRKLESYLAAIRDDQQSLP